MTHRLLILGSLMEFEALTKMAKARGIYTVVCDNNPHGPAKQEANEAWNIDVRDTETISRKCKEADIDGIITSFSDLLFECMVNIADMSGLPCYLSPEKLPLYRDKSCMKEALDLLAIPNPKSVTLAPGFHDDILTALSLPIVVKPVDSYGSRGIRVLYSYGEVTNYFAEASRCSSDARVLVEEYNPGYEFNLMSWVLDGALYIISIADREKTQFIDGAIPYSTRNVYPSRLIDQVYDQAKDILTRYISHTGQQDGALSMQFYWSPGNPVQVGEIAGRFLGYEHELVEYAGGLSIEELLLDSVYDKERLRRTLKNHSPFLPKCSAVLYFHGKDGTVSDQSTAVTICQKEDVKNSILFYQEGEQIDHQNPRPYALRLYLHGESREEIDARTAEILNDISILDDDGVNLLYPNKLTEYPK